VRKSMMFAIADIYILVAGLGWAQRPVKPRQPVPVMSLRQGPQGPIVPFTASGGSVLPPTVTFTSSNPDLSITGSSMATVRFRTTLNPAHFTVYAKALIANFAGCNSPLASSVTVACSVPTGVTCAASAALTNAGNGTIVATGKNNHNPARFSVTYTFQDSWSDQVGTACSLKVQYLYTEP